MESINVTEGVQKVSMQYTVHSQSGNTDWEVPLQEIVNQVTISNEKETDYRYYPCTVNNVQESWPPILHHGNNQNTWNQAIKDDKNSRDIVQQVITEEQLCTQLGCPNIQEVGACSLYINDRQDVDIQKHQNGIFLPECDLAKLPELATDIISFDGSVGSELLKVVDSEDEDLIVDDSETESEISVSDVGSSLLQSNNGHYELHCIVCGIPRSHTVEANFFHIDNTYPLTFLSKTPVIMKLVEIIPLEMHLKLSFSDNLICRRCFNLVDTAENLELRLLIVKNELCDFVTRTQRNNSTTLEVSQRNTQTCPPFIGREMSTSGTVALQGSQQSADLQKHITTMNMSNSGMGDCQNIIDNTSSLILNTQLFDQRWLHSLSDTQLPSLDNSYRPNINGNDSINVCSKPHETDHTTPPCPAPNNKQILSEPHHSLENDIAKDHGMTDRATFTVAQLNEISEEFKQDDKRDSTEVETVRKKNVPYLENSKFQCDRCGKIFSQKFKFKNHLNKHFGSFRFKCEYCSKGYTVEQNLILHLRNHKNLRCEKCPASFLSAEDLQEHLRSCNLNMFSCHKCAKMFISSEKLKAHIESHQVKVKNEPQAKKYECNICFKRFNYPTELSDHLISHNDNKSHECSLCSKAYKHKRHLNRHHRKVHMSHLEDNEKHVVGKNLPIIGREQQKNNLNTEKTTSKSNQSKEKLPNKKTICSICNKAVRKIKIHMVTHSNIKEFRCDICKIDFTLKYGLVRHLKNKHANKKCVEKS